MMSDYFLTDGGGHWAYIYHAVVGKSGRFMNEMHHAEKEPTSTYSDRLK